MRSLVAFAGGALLVTNGAAADAGAATVHKRSRTEDSPGRWVVKESAETWQPKQTAIIVCDMWDSHHSLNAVKRVQEIAPRMNEVLEKARGIGVFIIHA